MTNDTSMRMLPPQPLVCSALMMASDSPSFALPEMSW
jgi:hypothetical protein